MIIKLKRNAEEADVEKLTTWVKGYGVDIHAIVGTSETILGLVGDTSRIPVEQLHSFGIVEDVKRIQEPYKNANRKFHPEDTVIEVENTRVGGENFAIIAGPCAVESEEQIIETAKAIKAAGATMLRGGAFKPRTSPYSFQGLRAKGIRFLLEAKEETGLPVVTEIMDISQLPIFEEVDVIQVGARNMQNFELLKELGHTSKPILLKRGLSSTIEELLMSAEYIMSGGNEQVMLCERGIRTFETATRNTLDLGSVPVLKKKTHLPVIVDPSHAMGKAEFVPSASLAAAAAGADGLIIEVHNDPAHAMCDGPQALTPAMFADLTSRLTPLLSAVRGERIAQ